MRTLLLLVMVVSGATAGAATPSRGEKFSRTSSEVPAESRQSSLDLEVWVVADQSVRGREVAPVSAAAPVACLVEAEENTWLTAMPGASPTKTSVERVLYSTLRAQGFEPVAEAGTAKILLVYAWGALPRKKVLADPIPDSAFARLPPDPTPSPTDEYRPASVPRIPDVLWPVEKPAPLSKSEQLTRARLLVGDAFARRMQERFTALPEDSRLKGPARQSLLAEARRNPRGQFLERTIDQDLIFVVVTAYDVAGVGRGRRDVLWSTRVAVAAEARAAGRVVPALVIAAGPHLGRETTEGVLRRQKFDRDGVLTLDAAETIGWEAGWGPAPVKRAEAQ